MRWLVPGLMCLCGVSLAGEAAMDKAEAQAYLGLAKQALAADDLKTAELYLAKARAKYKVPGETDEIEGDIRVKQLAKPQALRAYVRGREAYAGDKTKKAELERISGKIAGLSQGIVAYLEVRDGFVAEARSTSCNQHKDKHTREVANRDLEVMTDLALREPEQQQPGGTKPLPRAMDKAEADAFLNLARKAVESNDLKTAEAWIAKADAKCLLPASHEIKAQVRAFQFKADEALSAYLQARSAFSGQKEDVDRVTQKIAKISSDLAKYLVDRDAFVNKAVAIRDSRKDELVTGLLGRDMEMLALALAPATLDSLQPTAPVPQDKPPATVPLPDPKTTPPREQPSGDSQATVREVAGADKIAPFTSGAQAFSNRKYTWTDIPAGLTAKRFGMIPGGGERPVVITVEKPGWVQVAIDGRADDKDRELLRKQGWEKTPHEFAYTAGPKFRWTMHVYKKQVAAGKLEIPALGWAGPVVLLP